MAVFKVDRVRFVGRPESPHQDEKVTGLEGRIVAKSDFENYDWCVALGAAGLWEVYSHELEPILDSGASHKYDGYQVIPWECCPWMSEHMRTNERTPA